MKAEKIVWSIVAESPNLYAPNVRLIYLPLTSVTKYKHQLCQIRRREIRKSAVRP